MRSSALKRRQSCQPWPTLAGAHIKGSLTCSPWDRARWRRQSCRPWPTLTGPPIKGTLSPVLHEIERVEETSKLSWGPHIKWPLTCFPWDRERWRRQSCLGDLLLNGLTCFPWDRARWRRQSCRPWPTLAGPHIKGTLSPVLHEIERVEETSKLSLGPPIKWPHLFSMRSRALKTSKLSALTKTLAGPHIKWPHLFSMRSSALKTSKLSALAKTRASPIRSTQAVFVDTL